MSIYYVVYGGTADCMGQANSATYATARNSTVATSFATSANCVMSHTFSISTYTINQGFLRFDLSSVPAGAGTGTLNLTIGTQTATAAGTIELAEASSLANKIAGASLASLSILASFTPPNNSSGFKFSVSIADISTLTRSSSFNLVGFGQGERLNVAPVDISNNATVRSADQTGTVDDPYLRLLIGTPWSFVGTSTTVETASTTLTLTEPAGVADGDLLVACIASRTTATTAVSNTGWTAVNSQNNNSTATTTSALASGTMLYQVRAGAPDLSFTLPAGISVALGRIIAYRGNAATTLLDASTAVTTATNTTAVNVAGLTTTQDDDLIVAMTAGGQEAAWTSFTNVTTPLTASGAVDTTTAPSPTAWIKRAETVTTTGVDTSLGVFDAVRTGTGATGNLTVTASLGAGHVVIAGAFKIAAAGGGVSASVTGQAVTTSVGTVSVTAVANTTVTGQEITVSAGTVTVETPAGAVDVDVDVTGQFVTAAVGDAIARGSALAYPTGQQIASAVGTVTVETEEAAEGMIGVWDGSAWVDRPAKMWTGSTWVQKPVRHWNGSAWV